MNCLNLKLKMYKNFVTDEIFILFKLVAGQYLQCLYSRLLLVKMQQTFSLELQLIFKIFTDVFNAACHSLT